MAVSRSPRRDETGSTTDRARRSAPSRYDLILALIPALLATAVLVHLALGMALAAALVPASLLGGLLLADAVFLNPPTPPRTGRTH